MNITCKSEKTCPLCGQVNACAAGRDQACWCFSADIPQTLRDQVPQAVRGKACICQNCVERFSAERDRGGQLLK